MPTRRKFLKQTAAAGAIAAVPFQVAKTATDWVASTPETTIQKNPQGTDLRIKSVIRRDETILRLGGHGDINHMSWAADDRQFVAVGDGAGWSKKPGVFYNSRLFAISGSPQEATFQDIPGYPEKSHWEVIKGSTPYNGFGTLALDGRIYQFLSTFHDLRDLGEGRLHRFVGAKLIYSPDNGLTWCNQDGSMPVVWEPWERRSRQNMVFFEEPQDAFSILTVLQMGKNYGANKDGFVYVYAPNGNTDGTMNQLVMFRVPKAQILNRGAYEYFAGLRPDGNATWAKDIAARGVVYTFPRGWVNTKGHPWAWHPSIVYNAPLGLYMMVTWGNGSAPDGWWFGKPNYFGLWVAPNPWGPWTQVHEDAAWTTLNNPAARPYSPQISPKWIAEDGKSFWLVWTDFQAGDEEQPPYDQAVTLDDQIRTLSQMRKALPYYSFNTQRVDLITA